MIDPVQRKDRQRAGVCAKGSAPAAWIAELPPKQAGGGAIKPFIKVTEQESRTGHRPRIQNLPQHAHLLDPFSVAKPEVNVEDMERGRPVADVRAQPSPR